MSDRRAQIVDAAARLVAQRGFAATSVDDVIREARLSGKSHFYHYFRSKEELGYAVLARQFDRFAERGLAVLGEPMIEPLDRLGLFIDALIAVQVARGCREGSPFGSLAAELADAHDGFRERIAGVFARWAAQLTALLGEARPQLTAGTDAGRLARFVIATLEGAMLMARVDRDPAALRWIGYDLKRFVAMHVREPVAFLGDPPAAAPDRPDAPPPAHAGPAGVDLDTEGGGTGDGADLQRGGRRVDGEAGREGRDPARLRVRAAAGVRAGGAVDRDEDESRLPARDPGRRGRGARRAPA